MQVGRNAVSCTWDTLNWKKLKRRRTVSGIRWDHMVHHGVIQINIQHWIFTRHNTIAYFIIIPISEKYFQASTTLWNIGILISKVIHSKQISWNCGNNFSHFISNFTDSSGINCTGSTEKTSSAGTALFQLTCSVWGQMAFVFTFNTFSSFESIFPSSAYQTMEQEMPSFFRKHVGPILG